MRPLRAALRRHLRQAVGLAVGGCVLAGVFVLYTRPGFMVLMIDQMWSCF